MIMQVYRKMSSYFFKILVPHSKFHKFLAYDGSKYTQKTTFETKMWSKTHIWTNLRFLCEIDQKVSIFFVFLLKMDRNIYKKTTLKRILERIYDFFAKLIKKSQFFVEKLKKMQPPKMTFRSQLEPSIKSYEYFMFLLNFRLEITLDWWILERP